MKKHPILVMCLVAFLIVSIGGSVAYYNTKRLGFDEDAVIFKEENDGITVFDYKIYYDDVRTAYEETKSYIPKKTYTVGPYIVDGFKEYII